MAAAFRHRRVSAYSTFDALVNHQCSRQLDVGLGVKNLLDTDPPYTNNGGQAFFQSGYDPTYANPRGRFVYARANWRF